MESFDPLASGGDIDGEYLVNGLSSDQSDVGNDFSTCLNCEETAKIKWQELPHDSPYGKSNDDIVKKHGTSNLFCTDHGGLSSGSTAISIQNERGERETLKEEQDVFQSVLLDEKKSKAFTRCATFPCPKVVLPDVSSVFSTANEKQCTSSDVSYARSVSLPTSFKLVSALKGSRAQNGASPKVTMNVKWAPDVYDPPATSLSHTVNKSFHKRPKAKKANKHKHNKGKSSRGNSSGRRNGGHNNSGNVVEPVTGSLLTVEDILLPNGYSKSEAEPPSSVSKQDVKCGSSFLREALAKVHISIGEAL